MIRLPIWIITFKSHYTGVTKVKKNNPLLGYKVQMWKKKNNTTFKKLTYKETTL